MQIAFRDLPPEITQEIAAHVAADGPRSIVNIRFTSRLCYACALPSAKAFFYHTVVISLGSIEELGHQVKCLTERLESANSFRAVRRLVIDGEFNDGPEGHYEWRSPKVPDFECSDCKLEPCRKLHGNLEAVYDGRSSWDRQYHWTHPRKSRSTRSTDTDEVWALVVDLLKRLPALKDLLYRSYQRFPPPLLRALHRERPKCRLHLQSFSLSRYYASIADPYELELISSPSLYRVMLSCSRDEVAQYPESEAALLNERYGWPPTWKIYMSSETAFPKPVAVYGGY